MFNNVRIIKVLSFILLLFILFQLVSIWWSTKWQKTLVPSHTQLTTQVTPAKKLPSVSVQSIVLPQVPKGTIAESSQAIETIPKPISPKKVLIHELKGDVSTPQKNKSENKTRTKAPNQKKSYADSKTSVASTEVMYNQLVANKLLNIELAWPNHSLAREKLFSYLYQCVGMKFAILDKTKLTVLMGSSHALHSEWLRVAQGELSSREGRLLTQHSLSGIPVRLFPKKIDWQFAHLLAQHLAGRNLTSFRAKYSLKPQGLFIKNIKVNGQMIKGSWQLITQQC